MNWAALAEIILNNLIEVLGGILAIVLVFVVKNYLIPWLKERKLYDYVKKFMVAAEASFDKPEMGETKKEWVLNQLDKLGFKYDKELVGKFIDGFVLELTAQGVINVDK